MNGPLRGAWALLGSSGIRLSLVTHGVVMEIFCKTVLNGGWL